MAFRIITLLCALALGWSVYEWGRVVWLMRGAQAPEAEFLVYEAGTGGIMLNEFTDYLCDNCTAFSASVADLRDLHPDLGYTIRPMAWINDESDKLTRLAFAAGTQGKFREIHDAFMERKGQFDDSFLRETFSLYGMNYDAMIERGGQADITAMIADNDEDAGRLGVGIVPSVMIGNLHVTSRQPIDTATVADLLPALAQARQNR